MKKTLYNKVAMSIIGCLFMILGGLVSQGWALPTGVDYWTPIHTSTEEYFTLNVDNIQFLEDGGVFGIYSVKNDDLTNPTIDEEYDVLFKTTDRNQVVFQKFDDGWYIGPNYNFDQTTGTKFSIIFGFYYRFDNNTYYTDSRLNGGTDPISIDFEPDDATITMAFKDSQGQDRNVEVIAHDVAPVPEPATILLFGTGLIGLAGFARKKVKKS